MGKVKIKKSEVWIDMTPMSDVMVLLLTFFMLTSTFVKNEPVKVVTPGSVSEVKVPDVDVLSILINPDGKIYMGLDKTRDLEEALFTMTDLFGVSLTGEEVAKFKDESMFGVSMDLLKTYLNLPQEKKSDAIKSAGIPTDSLEQADGTKGRSEFQEWVKAAKEVNSDLKITIKADEKTPYAIVKNVMSELQDMNENRYQLITSYKKQED